ncbi:MAG: hypothetical protein M1831_005281 [Alyxoria varia]|nr:MAG: hypothetical protein M1831_005281 [Alyxoria varia]
MGALSPRDVRANHAGLIRELGSAGIVLLKNENNMLPIKRRKTIGIFGNGVGNLTEGQYFALTKETFSFEFGTLRIRGGSGSCRFSSVVSPFEAIKARTKPEGILLQYYLDNAYVERAFARPNLKAVAPLPLDLCLATEGEDTSSLVADWNSTSVVNTVASFCPNTVAITHSGGINTTPWASNENVTAILAAHYLGQEIGNSIVDVLGGEVNPTSKLPCRIALEETDYNTQVTKSSKLQQSTDANAWQSDFEEGLMMDYRNFDVEAIPVRYEFGFGLSYANFSISSVEHASNLREAFPSSPPTAPTTPRGYPNLFIPLIQVTATVSNTGKLLASAVPQLYLSLGAGAPAETPVRQLRGFQKLQLPPGESKPVTFPLTRKDLSCWDV